MHCGTMKEGRGLPDMSPDELMKLAKEGPRSSEERWRDERERQAGEEMAHLHARINAMAELLSRIVPHQPAELGCGPAIPLGGQHMSVGARIGDEAVGREPMSSRLSKLAHELEAIAIELAA